MIKTKLPYYLSPGADESMCSWLIRLAHKYHNNVPSFFKILGINEKLNLDFDLEINSLILIESGIVKNKDVIIPKTLSEKIIGIQHYNYINPWLISRNRQQLCPKCLKKYGYFKVSWRLAIIFGCPICKILLIDQCSKCDHSLSSTKANIFNGKATRKISFYHCHFCGFDLRKSRSKTLSQNQLDSIIKLNSFYEKLPESQYSLEAYLFFTEFLAKNYTLNKDVKKSLGIYSFPSLNFNDLSPLNRSILLAKADVLVKDFPISVHRINHSLKMTGKDWFSKKYSKTNWTEKYRLLF